jgi:hypothetical protein
LSDGPEGIGIQKDYDAWQSPARFKPNPIQDEPALDQVRSSSDPDTGFNRDRPRGFKLTLHKATKKESKSTEGRGSAFGWNEYLQTFDFQAQDILDQTRRAIAGTRKTGEIAQSVLDGIAQKLSRYPATAVVHAARLFLEKNYAAEGKREEYLLGIVRRHTAVPADGYRPSRMQAGQTEAQRRIEQVMRELAVEGQSS